MIEDLPVVSSVRFHAGDKTHKSGVYANLRCGCGAKQVGPVRKSSKRPTFGDCLRELGRLIQQDHGPTCVAAAQKLQAAEKDAADASTKRSHDEGAASLNANQVLMLHSRLKIIHARAVQANKAALEAEKERDELHTQIEEIEEQLQPKRARSDADAGDAHEIPWYGSNLVFLLCFLVYRGTMRGGRSAVGARHARVCVAEDTDPSPVDRISWWKVVRAPSRPFGQKTNLLSQHHQGFGIVT